MPDVVVVVVAAGRGERLGVGVRKQYVPLAGVPVLARTLAALDACDVVDALVVVAPPGDEDLVHGRIVEEHGIRKVVAVARGGDTRLESVAAGLRAAPACEILAVHDGVRPLVGPELVRRVVQGARDHGAAVPVVPLRDTIKRAGGGFVTATVERAGLYAAQTPQAFRAELLRRAYQHPGAAGDDAQLVERLGHAVFAVAGDPANVKITAPEDLRLCEALLAVAPPRAARIA